MWVHECVMGGLTATESDKPCNWCNVSHEDIQQRELDTKHDTLEPVHE